MMEPRLSERMLNDPVTQHMRRDFTRIGADSTVGQALAAVRASQPQERIIYFYVTDPDERLVGVVPTRRLLLSSLDTPITDIMVKRVVAVPDSATVLDACEFFTLHRLLAFPVVGEGGRILGVVDVDLYTQELRDIERREDHDDLFQLIGVHLTEAQQANPLVSFVKRFPWLLCNIAGGILAAFLAGVFEEELQRVVALALFIPVVLALAESVSIQSVSLAIQTLHGRQPTWTVLGRRLTRELAVGGLLGGACGLLVGAVALLWLVLAQDPKADMVALSLLGGIGGGVALAATIGLAVPYLLHLLRRDPQVAAGPIALAFTDMVTLLAYFNLARWLLG
ncbi:MAG: magnesium transporter [Gemmataceae bacterium]|nr:magnesium transporter [Gemmataceae bacterium]